MLIAQPGQIQLFGLKRGGGASLLTIPIKFDDLYMEGNVWKFAIPIKGGKGIIGVIGIDFLYFLCLIILLFQLLICECTSWTYIYMVMDTG